MLWRGEHHTRYRFSRPVFLEPHLARLTPRGDAVQRLASFEFSVFPGPAGQGDVIDAAGNPAVGMWFDGLHEELVLTTRFTARTLRRNPFDYLLEPGAARLPLAFPGLEGLTLAPYLAASGCPDCGALGRELAADCGGESVDFLSRLTQWLYRNVRVDIREEPGILAPRRTLGQRRGACRDVTVVFVEACRQVGMPARYVSGYQAGDPRQDRRDLHAWAEVYLPGAGWRGYDPTLGLAVADAHLAVCAAHHPDLCAPLTGTFRGTGATSRLTHHIHLETGA